MLYIEKYIPRSLNSLVEEMCPSAHLLLNVCERTCMHMFWVTKNGIPGNKLIRPFIRHLFNVGNDDLTMRNIPINNVSYDRSLYHIELDATVLSVSEIFDITLSCVNTKNIATNGFTIVCINHIQFMSSKHQSKFKIIMQKYHHSCRFIFLSSNNSLGSPFLQNSCVKITFKVLPDSQKKMLLQKIDGEENGNCSEEELHKIFTESDNICHLLSLLELRHNSKIHFDIYTAEKSDLKFEMLCNLLFRKVFNPEESTGNIRPIVLLFCIIADRRRSSKNGNYI